MAQNNHMLQLLDEFQLVRLNIWQDSVVRRIPELLKMNLLARVDPVMLRENFHNDVTPLYSCHPYIV